MALKYILIILILFASNVYGESQSKLLLFKREISRPSASNQTTCSLVPKDAYLNNSLYKLLKVDKKSLVEFNITMDGVGDPLAETKIALDLHRWMRITTTHGRTLAEMNIKHDSLSSLTLSSNTAHLDLTLTDRPKNCFASLSEIDKIGAIKFLLARDFNSDGPVCLSYEDRSCHRVIKEEYYVAHIEVVCYTKNENTGQILEDVSEINIWLNILKDLLKAVRFILLFFGPQLLVPLMMSFVRKSFPYLVKLRKSIFMKAIFIKDYYQDDDLEGAITLDFRKKRNMVQLQHSMRQVAFDKAVDIKMAHIDIIVGYDRTLTEGEVHTGLLENICNVLFRCSIKDSEPFNSCCDKSALKSCLCCKEKVFSWSRCCYYVSVFFFILFIHIPFGLRLLIFYAYEYGDIFLKKSTFEKLGLSDSFDGSLFKYLLPTHPIFIFIYIFYFSTALNLAVASNRVEEGKFMKVILASFQDLSSLAWAEVFKVAMSNIVWPLKRFGFVGFFIGFVYWPLVIPLTLLLLVNYLIPTFYLITRIIAHSMSEIKNKTRVHKIDKPYQSIKNIDRSVEIFNIERYLSPETKVENDLETNEICFMNIDILKQEYAKDHDDTTSSTSKIVEQESKKSRIISYVIIMIVGVITLLSATILLSEIVGSVVEFLVFVIMGILINAAELLKYVVLVFTVVGYGVQCYDSVTLKYVKVNKALFKALGEILSDDLDEITSMPETMQENRGLKLLREEENIKSDKLSKNPLNHWLAYDLVMFIDNENVPRIPRKLFDEVCLINVPGIPGPVFESHIQATKQFLKILVFIFFLFVIVLTYGTVYNISHTNQMLATMVGGMIPLLLRSVIKQPSADVELESVSFRNKLNFTIKNFFQYWPIHDFPFELEKYLNRNLFRNVPNEQAKIFQEGPNGQDQIFRLTGNMSSYLIKENCLSQRFSNESWPSTLSSSRKIDLAIHPPNENNYES